MSENSGAPARTGIGCSRRTLLGYGAAAVLAPSVMMARMALAESAGGFRTPGPMNFDTGQEWIREFFVSADSIIGYYGDPFLFEDVTLFQHITDKETLYRAFLPFANQDPNSPIGVHYFDVVRYDGGVVPGGVAQGTLRTVRPETYTEAEWADYGEPIQDGNYDYDEWGLMQWVWKAKHTADFLGLPAAGKETVTRGTTFHSYKDRKIVREFTMWDFRQVAVQLGAAEPPVRFWEAGFTGQ